MSGGHRAQLVAAAQGLLLLLSACSSERTCPSATLPSSESSLPWLTPVEPLVEVDVNGRPLRLLLDTGFARSVLSAEAASGLDLSEGLDVELGGARVDDVTFELLLAPLGLDGILGADVLHRLPLELDARGRTTRLRPSFTLANPGDGSVPLHWETSALCAPDRTPALGEGLPTVSLRVGDGPPVNVWLDTGARQTFLASSLAPPTSPVLSGLPVVSGFAGAFVASARRLPLQSVGGLTLEQAPALFAAEIDAALDRAAEDGDGVRRFGFLGWTTLRAALVDLGLRDPAGRARLRLTPDDGAPHWPRDFIGVGVVTSPSAEPAGLRVESVLSPSPAQAAGVAARDIITAVDGVTPTDVSTLGGSIGQRHVLTLSRPSENAGPPTVLELEITVQDLLPDAAP